MTDRLALVTGASGGLGRAVAAALSRDGWRLAVVGRQASKLADEYPDERLRIVADVSTPEGARAAFEQSGPPDALVHCVGGTLIAPLHRTSLEQYRACMAQNLDSAVFTLGAFVAALRAAARPGAAVLVSSVVGHIGVANHEAVAAAKAGVAGLVRAAAATYAPAGIRINAVSPGLMETPSTAGILANQASRDGAAKQYPLAGIGQPGEVAALIAWLVSVDARRVTGQVWPIDGGFTAVRPLVR